MNGTIKTMTEKGFGFITPEGGDKDVFFHQSALVGVTFAELKAGDQVTFEVEQSEKGPRAANVSRA
jgi:CspA family cold shock protein